MQKTRDTNFKIFFTLSLLISLMAQALPAATKKLPVPSPIPNTQISTSSKAQAEINAIPKTQKQSSTDAQFSGILKLKDPRPQIITRDWQYFLGFKIQPMQAQGNVSNSVVGNFDLGNNAPTVHPSLELGFSKPFPAEDLFVNWGLVGQTGFSTEQVKLTFPSGYSAPQDTHLNTLTSSLGAKIEFAAPRLSALYFNTSARLGRITYTQTSLNDLAQFSEAATYLSLSLGSSYNFYENWQVTADYSNRKLNQKSSLKIQTDNIEIGLRAIW